MYQMFFWFCFLFLFYQENPNEIKNLFYQGVLAKRQKNLKKKEWVENNSVLISLKYQLPRLLNGIDHNGEMLS